jgi:hypothetical protein
VGNVAKASNATIGGGSSNFVSAQSATVGGGRSNIAGGPGAFVGGGGYTSELSTSGNEAYGDSSAIAGGYNNLITGTNTADFSFIGAGEGNEIRGGDASIVGGANNQIASGASMAFIGGGQSNEVTAIYGVIAGGQDNAVTGTHGIVLGGQSNIAGEHSIAMGYGAHAYHQGTLVWTCDSCATVNSSVENAGFFNAINGFWFGRVASGPVTPIITGGTFISTSTGALLTTGGVWANASDRNAKANFAAVDGVAILNTLMSVPIETWSYKAEDATTRHLGPVAQDFYAAFGLGNSDISIGTVDADGVALAAIQGLYTVVQEKDAALAEQAERIDTLEARLAAVENGSAPAQSNLVQLALVLVVGLVAGAGLCLGAFALGRRKA